MLVTGANGWIGRYVVAALRARDHEVIQGVRGRHVAASRGPVLDLGDRAGLERAVAAMRPESCLHLAWVATPGVYLNSPENLDSLHLMLDLLKALLRANCRRFVGTGTCLEYDSILRTVSEDDATRPTTIYGATKLAAAHVVAAVPTVSRMTATWARLFFQFGPREHPDRLIPYVSRQLLAGQPVELTSGLQVRDYLHVADVAAALVVLIERDDAASVVNVGSGTPHTVGEIARLLADLAGRPELVRLGALPDREGDPPFICADATRMRELGWRPARSLDEGLHETLGWWRANQ